MGDDALLQRTGSVGFYVETLSMHPKSCYDKRYKRREEQTDGSRKPFPAS